MKYYIVTDIHSHFTELMSALSKKGFFEDTEPHKLVICGDLYDRGTETLQLQEFILNLLAKNQVILIRGNHEDLALDLLHNWSRQSYQKRHHNLNGTVDTVCQLTSFSEREVYTKTDEVGRAYLQTPLIQTIIPAMMDYFETERYIFVHGWIPCTPISLSSTEKEYVPIPDWRNANKEQWDKARWINGMEAAHAGIIESGKTIVCGHRHCSFGHARYEHDGSEFENDANFEPYCSDGIIALDACTVLSGKVNCIVIEDNSKR
jgi:serine/threonine protein phosphatase 1